MARITFWCSEAPFNLLGSDYYLDALSGVDIALYDLTGKVLGVPVSTLLGGRRHQTIPAYVSGLPRATIQERCDLAVEWVGKGYSGIKFAAAVSDEGVVKEMGALREGGGPDIDIMVDLHWKFETAEAIRLIRRLETYNLYFAEAPVQPEDLEGQARVASGLVCLWLLAKSCAQPTSSERVSRLGPSASCNRKSAIAASPNSCRSVAWLRRSI